MDDLGFNKVAGAILATFLFMLLLMKLPSLFMAHASEDIAYKVGPIEGPGGDEPAIDLPFPQADWVSAMDASKGAKVFKKCKSCHNVDPGGLDSTGPALYGVVGNDIASKDGFKFSAAMTGLEGNWTYEALDAYLTKPGKYAPGTNMNFVGLKKPEDRAAVIEYLRLADDLPEALPIAKSAEPEMAKDEMQKAEMADGETMVKDETMAKDETMTKEETMVKDETMVKEETMIKEDTMIKDEMKDAEKQE